MDEQIIIKPHDFKEHDDVSRLQDIGSREHLEEFIDYKKRTSGISDVSASNLRASTCDILSYCNPHNATHNLETTHLVVGYVQSGKTMSFTALIEAALDYKYKVVIVLAGVTNNLLEQTSSRLKKDLKCGDSANNRHFKFQRNPDYQESLSIERQLKLKDSILVITVLKHFSRIGELVKIFSNPKIKSRLENETVLIIDDEADQASLNTYGRQNSYKEDTEEWKMSSTYESIVSLRNVLPGNSYIQYTATPQANVLINTLDILSPKTHTLLYPGEGYCGGKQFFGKGPNGELYNGKLIIPIPQDEVFNKTNNVLTEMPDSLKQALMMHLWAVTIVVRQLQVPKINQLSMMVHMDETLDFNRVFYGWIEDMLSYWQDTLDDENSKDYQMVCVQFRSVLNSAQRFYQPEECQSFEDLLPLLIDTINDTKTYLITGDTDDIEHLDWDDYSSNILVGAQMLNRGFTVENLATTYLSRVSVSITNADTIEQRCRFFGYKMAYIKSCRVYLPTQSITNYKSYIDSEEELRMAMSKTKSMEELGHKIMTSPRLHPTRGNVLPKDVVSTNFGSLHEFSAYEVPTYMTYNLDLIDQFIKLHEHEWKPLKISGYDADNFSNMRYHKAISVPVEECIQLLKEYLLTSSVEKRYRADSVRYLYYLSNNPESEVKNVTIILMADNKFKERTLNSVTHKLTSNLFEGHSPTTSNNVAYYPGDRNIYDSDNITIQIHKVDLKNIAVKTASLVIKFPSSLISTYCSTDD